MKCPLLWQVTFEDIDLHLWVRVLSVLIDKLKWHKSSVALFYDEIFYPFSGVIDLLKFKEYISNEILADTFSNISIEDGYKEEISIGEYKCEITIKKVV